MKQIRRSKSLTEMVLEELREAIISGQFKLGEPLSEIQLASSMGTSKTPVREAFAKLKIEGLVTVVPQSGTFVFTLSSSEVTKLCECRMILENAAFELSYQRNKDAFVQALDKVVRNMKDAHQNNDLKEYLKLDTEFHAQLFNFCENQYLSDSYSLIEGKIAALRTHLSSLPQHTQLSYEEHIEFIDSVKNDSIPKAKSTLETHIGRSKETYNENIDDISQANNDGMKRKRVQ